MSLELFTHFQQPGQRRHPAFLVERLETLRSTDPKAFAAIREGNWLDKVRDGTLSSGMPE